MMNIMLVSNSVLDILSQEPSTRRQIYGFLLGKIAVY